jgi:gp32 DNA binding protein like
MTYDLAALRKNSSLDKLTRALQQTNKQKSDERFWQPAVDKAGNGFAVIRFLAPPPADGIDGVELVQLFTHGFEGPGGWYIENSLTTLGGKDPVTEYNSKLWKSGNEANKKIAQKQKRRLSYISNILVIKDPANPQNEGKVFLFSYGKKIFDKVRRAIDPTQEEIEAAAMEGIKLVKVNVFDLWEGHEFKLKVRKVEGYRNYDLSEFTNMATMEGPAVGKPVAATDAEINAIWNQEHSLRELVTPDKFKPYAELEAKLNKVLGLDGGKPASKETVKSASVDKAEDATPPWEDLAGANKPVTDDDKMMNMFNDLAE